ncbi:MAG: hypothetical protein JWM81_707 [Candidatus Saccharibacteria bacterium]|nr:hypothetical protein [Candidatus Saccharibacteria bacterium]
MKRNDNQTLMIFPYVFLTGTNRGWADAEKTSSAILAMCVIVTLLIAGFVSYELVLIYSRAASHSIKLYLVYAFCTLLIVGMLKDSLKVILMIRERATS